MVVEVMMRRVFLLAASISALGASVYGCTGELNVGPWFGEGGAGERGPGVTATVGGGEGASGPASSATAGGSPVEDCTNPAVEKELTQAVMDTLYIAQLCDPSLDKKKCDLYVEGMCCEEVVDPKNTTAIEDYQNALQKWKDKGCLCPVDPPQCPPHEPYGTCDPTGFPTESEGICKKI